MKNLLLALFLLISCTAISQDVVVTDSVETPWYEQVAHIFENIDLTEITNANGLLLEHGFGLFDIGRYKGVINDTNQSSMFGFGLAHQNPCINT